MTGEQYKEILELLKERVAEFRQTTDKDAKANLKEGVEQLVSTLLADTIAALGVRSAHLQKRPSVSKPTVAPLETPLAAVVPAAPVFVSAEQIRKTRSQRQPMIQTGQSTLHSASNDSLTAESLAKRWLHSLAL